MERELGLGLSGFLSRWRQARILARHPISESSWDQALAGCRPAQRLGAADQAQLRLLATLLLQEKSLEPVQGLELDIGMRVLLAAHMCLPVLNLGLRWYRNWHSVVIYRDLFVPERDYVDAAGVVHRERTVLAGEAWQQGPVILSWQEVLQAGSPPGHNVVVHEMAHKLDMLNGNANGFPPLHADMRRGDWSRTFDDAYRTLQDQLRSGTPPALDPYGLEGPGEFFAVASEVFFETPRQLWAFSPDLYQQLGLFYRQRPLG